MVKKRNLNETAMSEEEGAVISATETPEAAIPDEEAADPTYENLLQVVSEIRKNPEIVGYILRNDAKATVDLDEPTKIVEYAMLSTQAFESSETLSNIFDLGETANITVQGKTLKALCILQGKTRLSIFMEKTANSADVLRNLCPQPT